MPSISTKVPTNVKIYKNIEEFDKNLPQTVTLLKTENGSKVYVIGTAHFSHKSQDDVSLVMQNVKPDKLVLELCPMRLHILYFDEERLLQEASELNYSKIRSILKQHGWVGGMFYIKFLQINANVTKQLGMAPGGECRRALAEAKLIKNCEVYLGDRLIYITIERAMRSLSFIDKIRLFMLYLSFENNGKITHEDVEDLKTKTVKQQKASSDTKQIPGIYNAFVRERDTILCHSLQYAANVDTNNIGIPIPVKVVGVVGIGHSAGIKKNWDKVTLENVQKLMVIPEKKLSQHLAKLSFKYGVLGLSCYGLFKIIIRKEKE